MHSLLVLSLPWNFILAGLVTGSVPNVWVTFISEMGGNFLCNHGFSSAVIQVIPLLTIALMVSLMPGKKRKKNQPKKQLKLFCVASQFEDAMRLVALRLVA